MNPIVLPSCKEAGFLVLLQTGSGIDITSSCILIFNMYTDSELMSSICSILFLLDWSVWLLAKVLTRQDECVCVCVAFLSCKETPTCVYQE